MCLPSYALSLMLSASGAAAQAPVRPAAPVGPQRPGALQPLPLTQLDDRALAVDLDNRTFTLTFAQPLPVKDLLLLLVRGTSLSIVPDPAIAGSFIGELKNVTVRQALQLILQPLGLDYSVDAGLIRVFRRQPETRIYDINYTATARAGSARVGVDPSASSAGAQVTSTSGADLFAELSKGVQTLVSERGAFNVDRKAGLLQVTDFPERLDRIATYLESVQDRAHRQVQIDARVLEVELSDEKAAGIDWGAVAQSSSVDTPRRPAMTGLRITDVAKLLASLEAQGTISTLAMPRLLTLNNEPAIVRADDSSRGGDQRDRAPQSGDTVVLSVTPQVGGDGVVTLNLTPIVTRRTAGPDAHETTTVREAETLARVADGETIVVAGFTRERESRERRSGGLTGGWLGRQTVVTRKRVELVILLTPRVLGSMPSP